MKPGEAFDCKFCGKSSFLKKVSVMDGWTKKGEILACVCCSAKIADINPEQAKAADNSKSLSKLASFLGTGIDDKPHIEASEDEKRFCKNCRNYIVHPFHSKCSLHNKEMGPMDDCPSYTPKDKA